MSTFFFSRVRLSDEATVKALLPLLKSDSSSHSLIWSLFAKDKNQGRDFLYREADDGWYYILSSRKPENTNNLFHLDEPKEFSPALHEGERLRFSLRANPVIRRRIPGTRKSRKVDIVMDALHKLPDKTDRKDKRHAFIWEKGKTWLTGQGEKHGFVLEPVHGEDQRNPKITRYRQNKIYKKGEKNPLNFYSLDFDGVLSITDASLFHAALHNGLGSAKGYGCGLMMIRRI